MPLTAAAVSAARRTPQRLTWPLPYPYSYYIYTYQVPGMHSRRYMTATQHYREALWYGYGYTHTDHTLDNSILNMPIGMSIGWGIAYRYLLTPSIGMPICRSIPIAWTNRSRENGTIGYCSINRHVVLTYVNTKTKIIWHVHAGRRADFFCGVYQLETRFARIIQNIIPHHKP